MLALLLKDAFLQKNYGILGALSIFLIKNVKNMSHERLNFDPLGFSKEMLTLRPP